MVCFKWLSLLDAVSVIFINQSFLFSSQSLDVSLHVVCLDFIVFFLFYNITIIAFRNQIIMASVSVSFTHQVFRVQVQCTTVLPASTTPVNFLSTAQVSTVIHIITSNTSLILLCHNFQLKK